MRKTILLLSAAQLLFVGCMPAAQNEKAQPSESSSSVSATVLSSEYGFRIELPDGYTVTTTGPNQYEEALRKGETISGTQPPSPETYVLTSASNPPLSIVVYRGHNDALSTETNYGGECGSQFADHNLRNEIVTIAGKTFLKRSQLYDTGPTIILDYCFMSDIGNIITLRASDIEQTEEAVRQREQLMDEIMRTLETTTNTLTGKRVLSIDDVEVFELLDNEWLSAESDFLWNYHNDYQIHVTLNKNAIQNEKITMNVTLPDGKKVYSAIMNAADADENGTLIFSVPNEPVKCTAFIATAEIEGQPSSKLAAPSTISGCGE